MTNPGDLTTTGMLRDIAVQALVGQTDAGNNVFSPLDQATWNGEYPVLFLTTPDEDGESFGRNSPPAFTVTSLLRIEGRAEEKALPDDAGAAALLVDLERLREQIKRAVINYGPLMGLLNQFAYYRTRIVAGPEQAAEHTGSIVVEIGLEWVQGPRAFRPVPSTPLTTLTGTVIEPEGTTEPYFSITLPQ